MKIVLLNERPTSWNRYYAGRHWAYRKNEADRIHQLIKDSIKNAQIAGNRVDIFIVAYFNNRPMDPDNIACKFYIDGLKGLLIKDDNREFVRWVAIRSEVDKKNPRVEIEVRNVLET